MEYVTDDILVSIIEELGETFDTHNVIVKIMEKYPKEYIEELYSFKESPKPIQYVHSRIGQRLLKFAESIGKSDSRPVTINVRAKMTENQQWRKLK